MYIYQKGVKDYFWGVFIKDSFMGFIKGKDRYEARDKAKKLNWRYHIVGNPCSLNTSGNKHNTNV